MSIPQVDVKFFKLAVGTGNIGSIQDNDISCRCPVCGDSKSKRNSKRLHLYERNSVVQVNCFNGDCPAHNKTMWSFLRDFYPSLLPQYKRETFGDDIQKLKSKQTLGSLVKKEVIDSSLPEVTTQDLSIYLTKLEDSLQGKEYLNSRNIEMNKFGQWYYGHQDLTIDDTLYKITNSIVIPLYYKNDMYGFYSRSTTEKTFVTYMNNVNIGYKIWNWFNIDKDERVYIFEGIFDAISSGHKNIIALIGAKLPEARLKELKNPVFCLDNDRTGLINALEYSKRGHMVYIQPARLKEKDFNELKLNHPDLNLAELIDTNVYSGISAQTRIKNEL